LFQQIFIVDGAVGGGLDIWWSRSMAARAGKSGEARGAAGAEGAPGASGVRVGGGGKAERLSALARELGKLRNFDHPEQEAALALVRTVVLQQGEIEQLFKSFGLSSSTYNILRILRHAPEGRSCSEIGLQLIARVPDVTRLLDGLEAKHLVERHRSSSDRRVVRVRITAAGLELLARIDEPLVALHKSHFSHMKRAEIQQLIELLASVRQRPGVGWSEGAAEP
jgi:DNA-binding MarR family transcriptional regulator